MTTDYRRRLARLERQSKVRAAEEPVLDAERSAAIYHEAHHRAAERHGRACVVCTAVEDAEEQRAGEDIERWIAAGDAA